MESSVRFKRVTQSHYDEIWHRFGGSFITHPRVIATIAEATSVPVEYYGIYKGRDLVGGIPTWDDWVAAHHEALSPAQIEKWHECVDSGEPEFILPICPTINLDIPFRATRLSSMHKGQIIGVSELLEAKRPKLMLARAHSGRTGLSGDTRRKLKHKLTHLIAAGGEILPIASLTPEELAAAYSELHSLRWVGHLPRGHEHLAELFERWRDLLFGSFVKLNHKIIALDVAYKVLTRRGLYVELVQAGWDPAYAELSPGTVMLFINTRDAWAMAREAGVPLRYSFGYDSAERNGYKHRWCDAEPLYRTPVSRGNIARRLVGMAGVAVKPVISSVRLGIKWI